VMLYFGAALRCNSPTFSRLARQRSMLDAFLTLSRGEVAEWSKAPDFQGGLGCSATLDISFRFGAYYKQTAGEGK
jgi:hypothetical protein